ncbi:cell division inhibitor SepF [Breznakia sp. PF5-3]|uniref:cell division protein SepF n=1 Tax=unclassified Breznakia TaxID=2623764 RepID=UPI00240640E8|nr:MULTISPECIES: cell division protein SepF [unclassified Breznakia]MDL2276444.1 cell division protein SepF [Breznakia sp. OttesenSCG-928-G09]MDF9825031.1 cell division inhibitor SepF [Breznakia sp. PM6-1]MDF9835398.1 cell division inhibitor SepF [Breznakia sp. PF5-3]MDF9837630.1 cell division inhibitor SepF [Breznakia sp. PFB2-8]MDF9859494.1 cell division inhibitor SepF [Breznakia sp. PH5-24]
MGFGQKIKEFISPMDEEEVIEYDEQEVESISEYEKPKSKAVSRLGNDTKMVLFEPRAYDEVNEVAKRLKENRAVVVNLHKLTREYAQRTIDFLSGVIYALDGTIEKIGTNVILCTPRTMGVHGKISSEQSDDE